MIMFFRGICALFTTSTSQMEASIGSIMVRKTIGSIIYIVQYEVQHKSFILHNISRIPSNAKNYFFIFLFPSLRLYSYKESGK